jgi:hypothetical protein
MVPGAEDRKLSFRRATRKVGHCRLAVVSRRQARTSAWQRLLRIHKHRLLDTLGLIVCLGFVLAIVASSKRLTWNGHLYTASATLTPTPEMRAFTELEGFGAAKIDLDYMAAMELRSLDFLYGVIDRHDLTQLPQLDQRWLGLDSSRQAAVYSTIYNGLRVKVLPSTGQVAVSITTADAKLASTLLAMLTNDLREQMRAQTLADLQRESSMLTRLHTPADSYAAASQLDTLKHLAAIARSAKDFGFYVQYRPVLATSISDGARRTSIALATSLVIMIALTLSLVIGRHGFPWLLGRQSA